MKTSTVIMIRSCIVLAVLVALFIYYPFADRTINTFVSSGNIIEKVISYNNTEVTGQSNIARSNNQYVKIVSDIIAFTFFFIIVPGSICWASWKAAEKITRNKNEHRRRKIILKHRSRFLKRSLAKLPT